MLNTNDIFRIKILEDGTMSIQLTSGHSKNIKKLIAFKRFLEQYYDDSICIVCSNRYNMRVICLKKITTIYILELFEKCMLLHESNTGAIINRIQSQLTVEDQNFLAKLNLKNQ